MTVKNLEDIKKDMEHGVYDLTDHGKCTGCGACCTNLLPMTKSEIKRIKRYVQEHGIKEQKLVAPLVQPIIDMTCPFMRKDVSKDRCVIYDVKPEICNQFKCDNASKGKWFDGNSASYALVDVRETFFGE